MVILLLFLGFLVALLVWVLFSPLILEVDTYHKVYLLRWVGLAQASFLPLKDDLILRLRLPFWRRDFSLLQLLAKPSHKTNPTRTRKATSKQNRQFRFSFRQFRRLLRSFRVPYFQLELDTDDFVMNAYLYSLCTAWSTPTRYVAINFRGRNRCAFRVQNRVANLLVALIF